MRSPSMKLSGHARRSCMVQSTLCFKPLAPIQGCQNLRSQRKSTENCGWMESTQQHSRAALHAHASRIAPMLVMAVKCAWMQLQLEMLLLTQPLQNDTVFVSLQMYAIRVNVSRSVSSTVFAHHLLVRQFFQVKALSYKGLSQRVRQLTTTPSHWQATVQLAVTTVQYGNPQFMTST